MDRDTALELVKAIALFDQAVGQLDTIVSTIEEGKLKTALFESEAEIMPHVFRITNALRHYHPDLDPEDGSSVAYSTIRAEVEKAVDGLNGKLE